MDMEHKMGLKGTVPYVCRRHCQLKLTERTMGDLKKIDQT